MKTLKPRQLNRRSKRAFTLMEIVIVIIIIGLLMGVAATSLIGIADEGNEVRVQADLQAYETALRLYRSKTGRYPTTAQGLEALVSKPSSPPVPAKWKQFMKKLNKDPWQQDYVYVYPGKQNKGSYDLSSKGANPDDPSDDIGNWQ